MGSWMRVLGRIMVGAAVVLFAWGAAVYLAGSDLGILGLIAAVGPFTFGIGLLAASQRA